MVKRSYNQFCPVSRTLDMIGERWTLLLVRELVRGPKRYSDLREALPAMASNLLATRLRELQEFGLITKQRQSNMSKAYVLTERGLGLRRILLDVARFGLPSLDMPTESQPLVTEQLPEAVVSLMKVEELTDDALCIRLMLDEADITVEIAPQLPPGSRVGDYERVAAEFTERLKPTRPDAIVKGSLAVLLWLRRGDLSASEALAGEMLRITADEDTRTLIGRLFGFETVGV